MNLSDQSRKVPKFGEGARISNLCEKDETLDAHFPKVNTIHDLFRKGVTLAGNKDCLGARPEQDGPFKWITYDEVNNRAKFFGDGLVHIGQQPGNDTHIGIYSINRPEYVIVDQAIHYHSMVLVPLYDTFGLESCVHIINHAEITCMVVDRNNKILKLLKNGEDLPKLATVVLFDDPTKELIQRCQSLDIQLYKMDEVEKHGQKNKISATYPKFDDIALINYTSGTTGMPKGCVITHTNIVSAVSGAFKYLEANKFNVDNSDILISYLPLAHVYEREFEYVCLTLGARIGYYQGDIKLLMEDIRELKPTIFPSVPRLLNRIYDKVLAGVAAGNFLKRLFFNIGLSKKRKLIKRGKIGNRTFWDRTVFKKAQAAVGGRVRLVATGSAPIAWEVLTFLRCILGCQVIEGYGITECMGMSTATMFYDTVPGQVGPPTPNCVIKLIDAPELNYKARDNQGEVCIKSKAVCKGYYKDPGSTAEVIDSQGWLKTGDIGTWTEEGKLKIIDRKKNIFKLSQGEYIAPEKIEAICVQSPLVQQIFVHGDSLQNYIVAIVVPDYAQLAALAAKYNVFEGEDFQQMCSNPKVREAILKDIEMLSKKSGLSSLEQVMNIHLHNELFTVENDLMTPTQKLKRQEMVKKFQPLIDKMYLSTEENRLRPDRM